MRKRGIRGGISFVIAAACCASFAFATDGKPGELLYNGIRLPQQWPPRIEKLGSEPMRVPYLQSPPSVIPIDVGRQLFVDDFLVETTTLKRKYRRGAQAKPAGTSQTEQPLHGVQPRRLPL